MRRRRSPLARAMTRSVMRSARRAARQNSRRRTATKVTPLEAIFSGIVVLAIVLLFCCHGGSSRSVKSSSETPTSTVTSQTTSPSSSTSPGGSSSSLDASELLAPGSTAIGADTNGQSVAVGTSGYHLSASEAAEDTPIIDTTPSASVLSWVKSEETALQDTRQGNGSALAALKTLPVKPLATGVKYNRTRDFGQAWIGLNGQKGGCDTRNLILFRDLTDVSASGCEVKTGILHDPYTNQLDEFHRGRKTSTQIQIDHVVPLANAWDTGAQNLSFQQREQLANDPLNLLAVSGIQNIIKGADSAADWEPPYTHYDCYYVARQIAVKQKYHLWVTSEEKAAMMKTLDACPAQSLPTETSGAWGLRAVVTRTH